MFINVENLTNVPSSEAELFAVLSTNHSHTDSSLASSDTKQIIYPLAHWTNAYLDCDTITDDNLKAGNDDVLKRCWLYKPS